MRSSAQRTSDPASIWLNFALLSLLFLLPLIACRRIIVYGLLNRPQSCSAFNELMLAASSAAYNRGVLAVNYFEHGFVRRGLGGTLLRALNETPLTNCVDQLIVFHLLSAIWVSVPLLVLVRQTARRDQKFGFWLMLVLLLSPHMFWAWGGDLGRVDMLTSGCIAWAVVFVLGARHATAIVAVLAGTLAHDSSAIFGVPLLFVLWAQRDPSKSLHRTAVLGGSIILVSLAPLFMTKASSAELVDAVLGSGPPSYLRDVAAYMTSTGVQSILTSWCESLGRPATPFFLFCVFLLIAIYGALLVVRASQIAGFTVATVVPTVVMSIIAIDYGRWLVMAVVNAWLFCAAAATLQQPPQLGPRSLLARTAGLLLLLAMRPPLVYVPSGLVEILAKRIWGSEGTKLREIEECDPAWRASLGLPADPEYPAPIKFRKSILGKD